MLSDKLKKVFDECSEFYLWMAIEQLGGFLWRMNHDLADGRIDSTPGIEEDLVNMQKKIEYAVEQTSRFGIEDPLNKTDEGKAGREAYWTWYRGWKKHTDEMSDGELSAVGKRLSEDHTDTCSEFRPKRNTVDPDASLERHQMLDLREGQ